MRNALLLLPAASLIVTIACSGPDTSKGKTPGTKKPPPFPTSFDALPPVEDPQPPDADKPGLAYLQAVHQQLQEPWWTFLEDCRLRLPPEHVLNNASLYAVVHISIDGDGELHGTIMDRESGQQEFDEVALEIIREAAPFPKPPMNLTSDDDQVHVRWLLARDRRQAGVATAELYHFEWPPERSVPKFLAQDDVTTAAHRLLKAVAKAGDRPRPEYLELGAKIAEAAVREGLTSKDPAVQLMAARAAAQTSMVAAAEGLRAILNSSTDIAVRAQAIRAIGTIGDRGAAQLLLATLNNAKGSGVGGNVDASIAAALALAELGSGDVAESTVYKWFKTADKESLWASLIVMSRFPVPAAVPKLVRMTSDTTRSREVRMAACTAVGAATDSSNVGAHMKVLRRRFEDDDAAVRAACTTAVANAARKKLRNRFTYWQVIEVMKKDRDERVREAAVRAAASLEPALFHSELYLLRKEKSVSVLAALAAELVNVPDPMAFQKLRSLAKHDNPMIRRPAVASMVNHPDPRARNAAREFLADQDEFVRLSAIRALRDRKALTELLADEAPNVRGAAFQALLSTAGKPAMLARMLRGIVAHPVRGKTRIGFAASWLSFGQ